LKAKRIVAVAIAIIVIAVTSVVTLSTFKNNPTTPTNSVTPTKQPQSTTTQQQPTTTKTIPSSTPTTQPQSTTEPIEIESKEFAQLFYKAIRSDDLTERDRLQAQLDDLLTKTIKLKNANIDYINGYESVVIEEIERQRIGGGLICCEFRIKVPSEMKTMVEDKIGVSREWTLNDVRGNLVVVFDQNWREQFKYKFIKFPIKLEGRMVDVEIIK
jgi:hypothetical protein